MTEQDTVTANRIRAYAYLSGLLTNQQRDALCGQCKAFVNTARATREGLAVFEQELAAAPVTLPPDLQQVMRETHKKLAGLVLAGEAAGQKKAGICKLPAGVCFVKSGKALLQSI